MGIKQLMGVFFRDQISDTYSIGYYVMNLNDSVGGSTHWVVMNI